LALLPLLLMIAAGGQLTPVSEHLSGLSSALSPIMFTSFLYVTGICLGASGRLISGVFLLLPFCACIGIFSLNQFLDKAPATIITLRITGRRVVPVGEG